MSYSETVERLKKYSDYPEFERLCFDLLYRQGYDYLDPQGIEGKDGGKDALYDRESKIEFHFSTRKDWKNKLMQDVGKTDSSDRHCDKIIFVTNREAQGTEKDKMKNEIRDEFGYKLEIYGAERLRMLLDSDHQDLREKHLNMPKKPRHSSNEGEEAERFHKKRLKKIKKGTTKISFEAEGAVVMHLIPRKSLSRDENELDIKSFDDRSKRLSPPLRHRGATRQINSNGVYYADYNRRSEGNNNISSYVKVFRNGIIEVVYPQPIPESREIIPSETLEIELSRSMAHYLKFYEDRSLPLPIHLNATLYGCNNTKIADRGGVRGHPELEEDEITYLGEKVLNYNQDSYEILRGFFDKIWNAAGYQESKYRRKEKWQLRDKYEEVLKSDSLEQD